MHGQENESQNTNSNPLESRFLAFGLDKLVFYWSVFWSSQDIFTTMAMWKGYAAGTVKGYRVTMNDADIEGGVVEGYMQPKGLRRWKYVLVTDYGMMGFSERPAEEARDIKGWVEASAEACWALGVEGIQAYFLAWVKALGGSAGESFVSRVDFASDFIWTAGFSKNYLDERRVGRQRKKSVHENCADEMVETYYVGELGVSGVLFRLYDKSKQLKGDYASFFWDVWNVTAGTDHVWRAEFQVGKEVLRAFGVTSLESLMAEQYAIFNSLTSETLSFREPTRDAQGAATNLDAKQRWPYAAFWELVRTPRGDDDEKGIRFRKLCNPEGLQAKLEKVYRAVTGYCGLEPPGMTEDYFRLWEAVARDVRAFAGGEDGPTVGEENFYRAVRDSAEERARRFAQLERWRREELKQQYLDWKADGCPQENAGEPDDFDDWGDGYGL